MHNFLAIAVAAAAALSSTMAAAQLKYTVTAVGTVSQVYASKSTPDGRVKVGDPFLGVLRFDTSAVTSSLTNVNGSSTGVYGFPLSYSFSAGAFSISGQYNNPALVIFDNYVFSPTFTGDSAGFSMYGGFSTNTPFIFSTPGAYSSFNFGAFDMDSSTLSNASLSGVNSLNIFPRKRFELGFTNADFTDSGIINVAVQSYAVTSTNAVPEPATWGMMIFGLGAIGVAMRRRPHVISRAL